MITLVQSSASAVTACPRLTPPHAPLETPRLFVFFEGKLDLRPREQRTNRLYYGTKLRPTWAKNAPSVITLIPTCASALDTV
jgi:hypothetical protein